MGEFMQNDIMDVGLHHVGMRFTSGNVLVSVYNTAYILHCPHVKVRGEDLVKLVEGVLIVEEFRVVFNALPRNSEPVFSNFIYILSKGRPAE